MMSHRRRMVTFTRLSAGLLAVQSILLLQFPLLDVLGLEFAVATAPLISLLFALGVVRKDGGHDELRSPYRTLAGSFRSHGFLILIPGVLALGNWIFVTNCAPLQGVLTYLLIVPFAAAYGGAVGLLSRGLTPGSPRSMAVLLLGLTLLHVLLVTLLGPQIFAFNPVFGFFPGFAYDSTYPVIGRLLLYRIVTLLLIGAACETVRVLTYGFPEDLRSAWRMYRRAVGVWVLVAASWTGSDELGISSSLSRIGQELGGQIRTDHFMILYPREKIQPDDVAAFGEYHEFLYHQVSRTLRLDSDRLLIAIYYESPEQKSELVGGGGTNFTKPWLGQMHLAFDDRARVLKHELVHLLATDFGIPLLGIGWNSGFIEGLAVALERESYGMPLERAAAAILHVRGSVDLSSVYSLTGFFRSHPSVSYSLSGAFTRFLIDTYGVRRFKRAYRSGNFASYGRDLPALLEEWRRTLDRIDLTPDEMLKAKYLFDRPPAFAEKCFQYKGNALRAARTAMSRGQDSLAVTIARAVYDRAPSFDAAYVLAQSLVRAGAYDEALSLVAEQFRTDSSVIFPPLSFVAGDALWGMDSLAAASEAYDLVRRADLSDGWTEASEFRRAALRTFGTRPMVRDAVIGSMSDSSRRGMFRQIAGEADHPLLWYGMTRWLSGSDHQDELTDVLERARRVESAFLRFTVQKRRASLFRSQRTYEQAKAALWESQNDVMSEVRRMEILEGISWVEWLEQRLPARRF